MIELWNAFVDLVLVAITSLAGAYGGNLALAILSVSFTIRLALLPWMVRLAVRAHESRRKLEALRPELDRIRAKYGSDPERLGRETLAIYRRHGVNPLPKGALLSAVVQLPVFSALYSAIQRGLSSGGLFLSIRDLARPDFLLIFLVAGLAAVPGVLQPSTAINIKLISSVLSACITVFILWKLASGLALYWGASATIGIVQALIIRKMTLRH